VRSELTNNTTEFSVQSAWRLYNATLVSRSGIGLIHATVGFFRSGYDNKHVTILILGLERISAASLSKL
jgi:hypothetical protein